MLASFPIRLSTLRISAGMSQRNLPIVSTQTDGQSQVGRTANPLLLARSWPCLLLTLMYQRIIYWGYQVKEIISFSTIYLST